MNPENRSYFLITLCCEDRQGTTSFRNVAIDGHPADFLIEERRLARPASDGFKRKFVLVSSMPITEEQFSQLDGLEL